MDLWCDGEHEGDVPATVTRTLVLDGGDPYLLDLCEPCDKAVQDIAVLMERGVLASQAITAPGSTRTRVVPRPRKGVGGRTASVMKNSVAWRTCPVCGHEAPTRSANGQHLKQNHEKKLSDFNWPTE